jgi:signal transduction histidine kinase
MSIIHPDDLSLAVETFQQVLCGEATSPYELRILSKSGEYLIGEFKSVPNIEKGKVVGEFGIARDITERKRAEEALRQFHEKFRALAERVESVREEERTRIAREVHDVVGQLLTGLKMDLAWIRRRLGEIADEQLRQTIEVKLGSAVGLADVVMAEGQRISSDLRPSVLDNLGLPAAIEFESRRFQQRSGIACELAPLPADLPLDTARATGVFRIFQEILTNVARHAQATRVRIRLGHAGDGIELEVADNGRGIRPEELADPKALGLFGIRERTGLLGGQLAVRGEPGRGTIVTLRVPVCARGAGEMKTTAEESSE